MTRAPIPEEYASDGAMPVPARALRLAWTFTARVVRWLKAIGALLMLAGGTLTDQFQLVDVQGFVRTVFGSKVQLPAIIAGVTIVYLALTILLKLPKGFSNNAKQDDGE